LHANRADEFSSVTDEEKTFLFSAMVSGDGGAPASAVQYGPAPASVSCFLSSRPIAINQERAGAAAANALRRPSRKPTTGANFLLHKRQA
jgi:hypothetical protein